MAFLDEIATFLQSQGSLSLTIGTNLFKGYMPPDPNVACAIYESGGLAPEFGFGTTTPRFRTPALQVVWRGAADDYSATRAKAELAFLALAGVEATTLSGTFYHWIHPQQEPFLLRRDESRRPLIAFNCLCEKE